MMREREGMLSQLKTMYVCIEVAFHGMPMESGGPTRPIRIVGPMSQTRSTIDTASRMLNRTNIQVCFLRQLYSRQLRVTCILIYRGAVSHQVRIVVED